MKKVAVIKKSNVDDNKDLARLCEGLRNTPLFKVKFCERFEDIGADVDRVLVFGGDGTVLAIADHLATNDINSAILGVNLGNLGFLTAFESNVTTEELIAALDSEGTKECAMLEACAPLNIGYAINDVVVKAEGSHPIKFLLYVDGSFVDSYRGDGIIVSTAIGSTAYSLSAGGPVLAPSLDALVINPICAHSLHSRPLVVSSASEIEIRLSGQFGAHVYVDGSSKLALDPANVLSIRQSQKKATFVDIKSDFFKKLLEKMNRWGIS